MSFLGPLLGALAGPFMSIFHKGQGYPLEGGKVTVHKDGSMTHHGSCGRKIKHPRHVAHQMVHHLAHTKHGHKMIKDTVGTGFFTKAKNAIKNLAEKYGPQLLSAAVKHGPGVLSTISGSGPSIGTILEGGGVGSHFGGRGIVGEDYGVGGEGMDGEGYTAWNAFQTEKKGKKLPKGVKSKSEWFEEVKEKKPKQYARYQMEADSFYEKKGKTVKHPAHMRSESAPPAGYSKSGRKLTEYQLFIQAGRLAGHDFSDLVRIWNERKANPRKHSVSKAKLGFGFYP